MTIVFLSFPVSSKAFLIFDIIRSTDNNDSCLDLNVAVTSARFTNGRPRNMRGLSVMSLSLKLSRLGYPKSLNAPASRGAGVNGECGDFGVTSMKKGWLAVFMNETAFASMTSVE